MEALKNINFIHIFLHAFLKILRIILFLFQKKQTVEEKESQNCEGVN